MLMGLVLVLVFTSVLLISTARACDEPYRPPWVLIPSPTGGTDVSSGCEIVAQVVHCDVEVKSVEFLVDGKVVGTDDKADEEGKFRFKWNAADVAAGKHTITAKANLANGEELKDSDEVKVIVK